MRTGLQSDVPTCLTQNSLAGQGAFLGAVMGQMTKLDPSVTNQLLNQPNANPGTPGSPARQQTSRPAARLLCKSMACNKRNDNLWDCLVCMLSWTLCRLVIHDTRCIHCRHRKAAFTFSKAECTKPCSCLTA